MKAKPDKKFNGLALITAMFREMKDPVFKAQLLKKLEPSAPHLVRLVQATEFMFLDLIFLEDRSLQDALRSIPHQKWLVAWKLTPKILRDKFSANMSQRHLAEFEADFVRLPRMRKVDVVKTQIEIARLIHAKICEGKYHLHSKRKIA